MRFISAGLTDVGHVRDHNEDSLLVSDEQSLFAVCDGVGGGLAGEVASAMTVDQINLDGTRQFQELDDLGATGSKAVVEQIRDQLVQSLLNASEAIYSRSESNSGMRGMSTTAVVMQLSGARGAVAHVGDSRIYVWRHGRLCQLTEDHTLARELLHQGLLNEETVKDFRYKNVISRAVGQKPAVAVDSFFVDVLPGDLFLLCSDGLTDQVNDVTISNVLKSLSPQKAAEHLVKLANEAGGKDNCTVVIIQAAGNDAGPEQMQTLDKVDCLRAFQLFQDLTFPQTIRLLKVVHELRPKAGEIVIREAERGGELYLVASGRLEVSRKGVNLSELDPGQQFGELGLITDQVRSATVTATEDSVLLQITRPEFLDYLKHDAVVAAKLLWRLLQDAAERIKSLSETYSDKVLGDDNG